MFTDTVRAIHARAHVHGSSVCMCASDTAHLFSWFSRQCHISRGVGCSAFFGPNGAPRKGSRAKGRCAGGGQGAHKPDRLDQPSPRSDGRVAATEEGSPGGKWKEAKSKWKEKATALFTDLIQRLHGYTESIHEQAHGGIALQLPRDIFTSCGR